MTVVHAPGVYPAQRDTWLLADVLRDELTASPRPRRVLELCAGAGTLSVLAAGLPGTEVTAVDISWRAVVCAWTNARRSGRRVRLHRGDLGAPVAGHGFDVVVANPPYVPVGPHPPGRGPRRAFDGGPDGRVLVDRVCDETPDLLRPGGCLLVVHSAFNGVDESVRRLAARGLDVDVAARCEQPFGPVLTRRAPTLERRGLIARGQRTEELVVVRGRATRSASGRGPTG